MKTLERELKALANRRRLAILQYLKKRKRGAVGEIAGEIKLSFKSTSRHLAVLKAANIIESDQRGPSVFYRLADKHTSAIWRIVSLL